MKKVIFLNLFLLTFQLNVSADAVLFSYQGKGNQKSDTIFKIKKPDFKRSPYTGMTRAHWKDASLYLLDGVFSYVHNIDDPLLFPKQPGKSYPRTPSQTPVAMLEGLCRTMFIAGPLLHEDPSLIINKIKVGDYYRHQITKLLNASSPCYIKHRGNGGPSQTLVEFGGLAVSLMAAPDVFWEPLPQAVKDSLAVTMLSYGEGPTIGMNWRFFNINILSFFKSKGYSIHDEYLKDLLEKTLGQYRGDGWYNDSPYFDYYSMWAFQMYGTLWVQFFGKEYYPEIAARFMSNLRDLPDNYPYMFSKKGEMMMWGRSIAYRMGAAAPLPLLSYLPNDHINYGWMRRIASGCMLQFLQNPDFLTDGIPNLGFYGPFDPAVQSYSCRGSVFWMGKLFLGLYTPADSKFWTEKENDGPWNTVFKSGKVYNKFEKGSGILITDYPDIGSAELRSTTNSREVSVYQGTENYNRLSYNTAFPWQADGQNGEVAMNYMFKTSNHPWEALRMFTFKGFEKGIYYRNAVLASDSNVKINLGECPLPQGILRVDRNTSNVPVKIRLGHYALPRLKTAITYETKNINGYSVSIMNNGVYQLAVINLSGWMDIQLIKTIGLNAQSSESAIFNVLDDFDPTPSGKIYVTLMLWKKSGVEWRDNELVPVKKIKTSIAASNVDVYLNNGQTYKFNFQK